MSSRRGGGRGPLRGNQEPRLLHAPTFTSSLGKDAVKFCRMVGIDLDPWQQNVMHLMLAETDRDLWACFEFGLIVARQNGKGEVLLARELYGLVVLEEPLILHTAHQMKTAAEGFRRLKMVIANSPILSKEVPKIRNANGDEGVESRSGCRIQFIARSNASGRGFTGDTVIWDEAQILSDEPVRAMMPTLSSVPNPQLIYTATAGNQQSFQMGAVRRRAIEGGDGAEALGYMEWSVDEDDYDPGDPGDWAKANPAMGIRISPEYIAKEQAAMSPEGFAAERLTVGDWPSEGGDWVIPADKWHACGDPTAVRPGAPLVFSLDVTPMRNSASVCVAGIRPDQLLGVEVADHRSGLEWVIAECKRLDAQWLPDCWVLDSRGPAGTFVQPLRDAGLNVIEPSTQEVAQAAGGFYDLAVSGGLRHPEDPRLNTAVAGGEKRPVGDAWAWGRRQSSCDISPLVAASLAAWGCKARMVEGFAPEDVTVI